MLPSDTQVSLSKARITLAEERIDFAKEILKIGDYFKTQY